MKKLFAIILVIMALAAFVGGCADDNAPPAEQSPSPSPSPTPTDTLEGGTADVLAQLIERTNALLDEEKQLPGSYETEVTNETSPQVLGVSSDDFDTYIESAHTSAALISTHAYEITIVKCADVDSAETVKQLIIDGYDPWKWICISPEQSYIVRSGTYLLVVSATQAQGASLVVGFSQITDNNVQPAELFYLRSEDPGQ